MDMLNAMFSQRNLPEISDFTETLDADREEEEAALAASQVDGGLTGGGPRCSLSSAGSSRPSGRGHRSRSANRASHAHDTVDLSSPQSPGDHLGDTRPAAVGTSPLGKGAGKPPPP